jgi:shikimate dehydrogenase
VIAVALFRFAVIGDPVAHSRSPAMHAAAFAALGLPHTYEALHVAAQDLPRVMEQLSRGAYAGFNVTVPHKRAALHHVSAVTPSAERVGAANTIERDRDGTLVAHNTDVPALAAELRALAPDVGDWKGARALVLGAGGAARAAIVALKDHLGVADVEVRARRPGALDDLKIKPVQPLFVPHADWSFDLVVQATSAGMSGGDPGDDIARAVDWQALPARAVVLETIYAPAETPLLHAARARALRSTNGLGMLARQGALALEIWLGTKAPLEIMLKAIST